MVKRNAGLIYTNPGKSILRNINDSYLNTEYPYFLIFWQDMKLRLIIVTGLAALITNSSKGQNIKYSEKMVETRAMKTFVTNVREQQLATAHWDYVPGLVAFSVLKAWEQYPEKQEYYNLVKAYADHCLQGGDSVHVKDSNVDDLAAGKIFFALYKEEARKGNMQDANRYKTCVTRLRNTLKFNHSRIGSDKPGTGGFFHKAQYPNQMWLDGLYMGAALYAGWEDSFGKAENATNRKVSWTDIAHQFKIIHKYTYDKTKHLNYHAWSADPTDKNSFWAKKSGINLGCSPEFWGRGMGWYFAALVDVLEIMPKNHADYKSLVSIVNDVAAGLAQYQDRVSGCWYQLLQYDASKHADGKGDLINGQVYNNCDKANYLESSASSMFTYAYYKGIRLGVLNKTKYLPIAKKAYKGLLTTFIQAESNGDLTIKSSCASAGLGPAKDPARSGTFNYYLCGPDIAVTQNEGKAVGPFILASLEYERAK